MQRWIHLLKTRQEEFIQRLEVCLHTDEQHLHGIFREQAFISEKFTLNQIRDFSAKIDKYKIEDNFLGKLGEAAVKKYIKDTLLSNEDKSDILSPLDCKLYENGDGGSDFSVVRSRINTYLQIKTTRLETHNKEIRLLKWSFSEREISKNRVLVCAFIYQNLKIDKSLYYVVIAGFLSREVVLECVQNKTWKYTKGKNNRKYLQLTIQDLIHSSGLLPYLLLPQVDKLHQNSSGVHQADELGTFYLRCGLYQEALKQIDIALRFQPNFYDALLNKSACFFAFAENQVYKLHQKRILDPTDKNIFRQEPNRGIYPPPLSTIKLVDGDNLELDDDLTQFVKDQHCQLYPGIEKEPRRKTSSYVYDDDDYLYWQVIKDTSSAIAIDATRPEAYFNRALAYEQLSLGRGMPNVKLAGRAIWNYGKAILCSAKRHADGISSPLFYYYRGRAYADYECRGLISSSKYAKWRLIYYKKAMVDLKAAYVGYSQ